MSSSTCTACTSVEQHETTMNKAACVLVNFNKRFFSACVFDNAKQAKKYSHYQFIWDYLIETPWRPAPTIATYLLFYKVATTNYVPVLSHLLVSNKSSFAQKCHIALFLHNCNKKSFTPPIVNEIVYCSIKGDCVICDSQFADFLAVKCGHVGICTKCYSHPQFNKKICPICRTESDWHQFRQPTYTSEDATSHVIVDALITYLGRLIELYLIFMPVTDAENDSMILFHASLGTKHETTDVNLLKRYILRLSNKLNIKTPLFSEHSIVRLYKNCDKCKLNEATHYSSTKQLCEHCQSTCERKFTKIQWA